MHSSTVDAARRTMCDAFICMEVDYNWLANVPLKSAFSRGIYVWVTNNIDDAV